jgi:hypothetical protein
MIPPASLDEADLLARAGPFVLDLLPEPDDLTADQAARVVRTIAGIGGEAARDKIAKFTPLNESLVIDELLRAWRASDDPEGYAREVLADIDFADRDVTIRGWHRAQYLPHLVGLRNLECHGDLTPLTPVAGAPRLRRLALNQNGVLRDLSPLAGCAELVELRLTGCSLIRDLAPLAGSRALRVLYLSQCPLVRDLAPLAETSIEELSLYLMACDLGSLAGAGLTSLAIRDRRLADGMAVLPADLPLRRLRLDNLADDRNLRGVERWPELAHVTVWGVPDAEETECLRRLPRLRDVAVRGAGSAAALAAFRAALPHVTVTDEGDQP